MKRVGFALGCLAVAGALVSCSKSGDGPVVYRARAVLQVVPEKGATAAARTAYIVTQAELARGREVLERVAAGLGLAAKWELEDPAEVLARLSLMVSSARVGESDLVEIAVEGPEPQEAADIANAAAESFAEWRREVELGEVEQALDRLEAERAAQEVKLEESRRRMLELMEKNAIIDLGAGTGDDGGAAAEVAQLRAVLRALDELEGDDLIRAAAELGGQGLTLTENYPEYLDLRIQERALLEGGLGTRHPKVVATSRSREALGRLLVEAVEESKKSLEMRLAIAERKLVEAEEGRAARAGIRAEARANALELDAQKAEAGRARKRSEQAADEIGGLRAAAEGACARSRSSSGRWCRRPGVAGTQTNPRHPDRSGKLYRCSNDQCHTLPLRRRPPDRKPRWHSRLARFGEGFGRALFRPSNRPSLAPEDDRPNASLNAAERQLGEYFDGRRERFELALDACGTDFQTSVWEQLRRIPFGETASYGDLAKRLGKPGAMRAVGLANGANPISIIVPVTA